MQGPGHQTARGDVGAQCGTYALEQALAGVRPTLSEAWGGEETDDGEALKKCDVGVFVHDDDGDASPRVAIEVEFTNTAPVGIANRQVELFEGYETLRAVLALKFYPYSRRAREQGRIPAVGFYLGKEDDGLVHDKRVFEMGTAPSQLQAESKRNVRNIWTRAGFVLDAGVDDLPAASTSRSTPTTSCSGATLFPLLSTTPGSGGT